MVASITVPITRGAGKELPIPVVPLRADGTEAAAAGDASAANQTTEITRLTSILAKQPAPGTAGTASTDVVTVQGIASGTPVVIGGAVASGAADSGNPAKIGGVYNSTYPTFTNGQRGDIQITARGRLSVSPEVSSATGTDGLTNGNIGFMVGNAAANNTNPLATAPYVFNGSSWDRNVKANATSRIISSAASTNGTSAKASAGNALLITGRNASAGVIWLKLYNKASTPTVGTDTPVMTIPLPALSAFPTIEWLNGYYFSLGIAYALTTGSADADTGAIGAGDILGLNLNYS